MPETPETKALEHRLRARGLACRRGPRYPTGFRVQREAGLNGNPKVMGSEYGGPLKGRGLGVDTRQV